MLGQFLERLTPRDLLLITADHGCDPSPVNPTTDHSREYVPVLAYGPGAAKGVNLGTRSTLADLGQTVAANFHAAPLQHGTSFLETITRKGN
jgi:phosphopentomutase